MNHFLTPIMSLIEEIRAALSELDYYADLLHQLIRLKQSNDSTHALGSCLTLVPNNAQSRFPQSPGHTATQSSIPPFDLDLDLEPWELVQGENEQESNSKLTHELPFLTKGSEAPEPNVPVKSGEVLLLRVDRDYFDINTRFVQCLNSRFERVTHVTSVLQFGLRTVNVVYVASPERYKSEKFKRECPLTLSATIWIETGSSFFPADYPNCTYINAKEETAYDELLKTFH